MLDKFLTRDSTSPAQRDAIRRMLEMVPEREPTSQLLPIDEAKEKLKCIKVLEFHWRKKFSTLSGQPDDEFQPLHQIIIATAMMMDINTFRDMMPRNLTSTARTDQFAIEGALKDLMMMPCFIKKRKSPSERLSPAT